MSEAKRPTGSETKQSLTRRVAEWIRRNDPAIGRPIFYHRQSGKIHHATPVAAGSSSVYSPESFRQEAPLKIYLDYTYRCNLKCRHCLTTSSPTVPSKDEMQLERIVRLCEELETIGVLEIAIGGGEPFVRQDWVELLQGIANTGISLILTTNGILVDETTVMELLRVKPMEVRVSFEGAMAFHEKIRGPRTYLVAMNAIELLARNGMNVVARLTVCRGSMDELPTFFHDVVSRGVRTVKAALVKPIGRASTPDGGDLLVSEADVDACATLIVQHGRDAGIDIELSTDDFEMPIPIARDRQLRVIGTRQCGAGLATCYIAPDGKVLPCVTIPNRVLGSVALKNFVEVWNDKALSDYKTTFSCSTLRRACDLFCTRKDN